MNLSLNTKGVKVYTSCLSLNSGVCRGYVSKINLRLIGAKHLSVFCLFTYAPNMDIQWLSGISIVIRQVISGNDLKNCC